MTLSMELLMNLSWRYMSDDTFTSRGNVLPSSDSTVSIFAVRSTVLVLGCLVTVTMTHCLPSWEAVPILGLRLPILTSATLPNSTGPEAVVLTSEPARVPTLSDARTPRMIYSLPYS